MFRLGKLVWLSLVLQGVAAVPPIRVLLMPTVEIIEEQNVLLPLAQDFSLRTGIDVEIEWASTRISTDYAGIVRSFLKAEIPKPDAYDVYILDVVWPGEFAPYLLPLDSLVSQSTFDSYNQDLLALDRVDGLQVAIPWYTDYGLFYYRTDLLTKYNLNPPQTWDDVEHATKVILAGERSSNPTLAGFVTQLDSYEGLMCNLAEWVKSTGSDLMDENGLTLFSTNETATLLKRFRNWIDHEPWAIPTGSLVYREAATLSQFEAGNAIFMRHWPHSIKALTEAWASKPYTFDVSGAPGLTPEQAGAAAVGGWHLAISKQTNNAASAAQVVEWLASAEIQKARALNHGVLPSLPVLFEDADVCATVRNCEIYSHLRVASRPAAQSGSKYLAVSQKIYSAVHDYLAGTTDDVNGMLETLRVQVESLVGSYVDPARGPPVYISYTSALAVTMFVLYGVVILAYIVSIVIILANRQQSVVRASSPYFCLVMIFGTIVNLATIVVYTGQPTRATCALQPWMLSLSFAISLLGLLEKNWRIFKIFNNPYMRSRTFTWAGFLKRASPVLLIEMTILCVWTGFDAPAPHRVYLTTYNYLTCRSSSSHFHSSMMGLLFAVNGLLIVAAIALAWITRTVQEKYNEAKKISFIVWNIASFSFIGLAVIFIEALGVESVYAIRSFIILECNAFFFATFFGPIMLTLVKDSGGALVPGSRSSKSTRSPSSSGTGNAPSGSRKTSTRPLDDDDAGRIPLKTNVTMHVGTLVGKVAKSKFALSLAPLEYYRIVLDQADGSLVLKSKDIKKAGLALFITSIDFNPVVKDSDDVYYFAICINEEYYLQFLTSSIEVVNAWTECFRLYVTVKEQKNLFKHASPHLGTHLGTQPPNG
ncbi:hypothetical protein HDU85_006453 [Gaertneriomyces sp. JEL0708]|nr:hypothetical protein HDU85_006453 [Gaertneriomyces sp. JEL0708]